MHDPYLAAFDAPVDHVWEAAGGKNSRCLNTRLAAALGELADKLIVLRIVRLTFSAPSGLRSSMY